jgi:DNA-directed RNA polymerase specialized sigma subunit
MKNNKKEKTIPNKKESKDYLSNKQMYIEIIECQRIGKISDKLGKMFLLISQHFSTKKNFSGYSYRSDMISAGIVSCCVAFPKFDPQRSDNPFAYFSQVVFNAYLQTLNKEKNHQKIRDKLLVEAEMTPSFGYLDNNNNPDDIG